MVFSSRVGVRAGIRIRFSVWLVVVMHTYLYCFSAFRCHCHSSCCFLVKGIVKTCYWVVAMLTMTAGLAHSVYALTSLYLRNEVSVSVNLHQAQQLVFPAVTVCNMSPVKKSAMRAANLAKRKRRKKRSAGPYTGWPHKIGTFLYAL